MGVVYLARQISLNRLVALKVLGASLTSPAAIDRFRREAQAAARLKHPGIAQIYYVGQEGGICFMAIEYVEGASLRQVIGRLSRADSTEATIDSVTPLAETDGKVRRMRFDVETEPFVSRDVEGAEEEESPAARARAIAATAGYMRRCCEIVRDAAIALEHSRKVEVVHRDIKPENLMVDREGKTYIIDFGIARFFEDRTLTYTGQLVGTPMYMSPEQVTGRVELDHRTDIYSLGMVLYELLTLRPPITATT
jgi:serine/threonine protein kinase